MQRIARLQEPNLRVFPLTEPRSGPREALGRHARLRRRRGRPAPIIRAGGVLRTHPL